VWISGTGFQYRRPCAGPCHRISKFFKRHDAGLGDQYIVLSKQYPGRVLCRAYVHHWRPCEAKDVQAGDSGANATAAPATLAESS
jgi:hypothetical protein